MVRPVVSVAIISALALAQAPPRKPPAGAPVRTESFESVAKRAEAARSAERLDEAIALYRRAVRMRPKWTEGWWYLATILYDQNRYPEARDAFLKNVQLDPKSGPAYALLGLCFFNTQDYRRAAAAISQAEELKFGGSDDIREVALFHLGMALTKLGQFDAATAALTKFARRGIDKPPLIEAAGIAALRKPALPGELSAEDRELALAVGHAVWQSAAQRAAAAEEEFRQIVARYPNAPNVHYVFGSFLLLTAKAEEGFQELLKELEISPEHVPCLVQVAFEYLKLGEAAKGEPYARRAVKLEPQSFVTHNALGRVLVETEKLDEGIKELEIARGMAPDSPQTRFALGGAYRRAGRKDEAAKEMAEFDRLKKLVDEQKKERQ